MNSIAGRGTSGAAGTIERRKESRKQQVSSDTALRQHRTVNLNDKLSGESRDNNNNNIINTSRRSNKQIVYSP